MAFNPDEYLTEKQAFNPDAYLSDFNPDEYLSGPLADKIPGSHVVTPAVASKTPIMDAIKGTGEAAFNVATGGTTGMLGGTLGMVMNPVKQALTGNINNYQDFSNALGEGFQHGMEQGTYQPKTETGQEYVEKYVAPVVNNLMPVAGLGHSLAPHLPDVVSKGVKDIAKEVPKAFDERALAEQGLVTMDRNIADAAANLTDLHKVFKDRGLEVDAENSPLIALRQRLDQMKADRDKLSDRLTGDITDRVQTEQDIKQRRILDEAQASVEQATAEPVVESKTSPHEVALEKIGEAMQEAPDTVGDRIWAVEEKLKAIPDTPENSALRTALEFERSSYEKLANGEKLSEDWLNRVVPKEEVVPVEIQNKRVPTSVELATVLKDHTTVGEVFKTLKEQKLGTMGQRVLIGILEKIPHVLTSAFELTPAEMFNAEGKAARGMYNSGTHTTSLHEGGTIQTLLHESVHAATVGLLNQNRTAAARQLTNLYNTYNNLYGTELKANGNKHYGFTNVKEFIAEAFNNKEFQTLLESKPSTMLQGGSKNLWEVFKNVIKDALGKDRESRSALDDVLEAGQAVMEKTATKSEGFFQKLSEVSKKDKISPEFDDTPTGKSIRGMVGRNWFGMNTTEGFYKAHPLVQKAFRQIKEAHDTAEVITNNLWFNTDQVLKDTSAGFMASLSKVKSMDSPYMVVKKTMNVDMHGIMEVFRQGFEQKLDYTKNLDTNGSHLTPTQKTAYNTLSKMFQGMYDAAKAVEDGLGKANIISQREGWYPAKRRGQYAIQIGLGDTPIHYETFPTRLAAEAALRKIGKLSLLDVSDVMDLHDTVYKEPNKWMADALSEALGKEFPKGKDAMQEVIDRAMRAMYDRGGKLGQHHEFRSNIPGYKGSELFQTPEQLGKSWKDGIQAEVTNFTSNMKTMMIKDKLQRQVEDKNFKATNPVDHAAIEQFYDSALGRNEDMFGHWEEKPNDIVDKTAALIMKKALGITFEGKEKGAIKHTVDAAMRSFYATKMMAKLTFPITQFLNVPLVTVKLAEGNHPIRAFYSTFKSMAKLLTRDKELMQTLFTESQEFGTIEPQMREALNLDKNTGIHSKTEATVNGIEDYVLLGKIGTTTDAMGRALAFSAAYTHYIDLGLPKEEARFQARRVTDSTMNTYGQDVSPPVFSKLGILGQGMKPLTSFSLNYLGNVLQAFRATGKADFGPVIALGLVSYAVGGALNLPFIQDYEILRKVLLDISGIKLPSILDIIYRDESFMDRLHIDPEHRKEVKDSIAYGPLSASTGIDLSASARMNEDLFVLMGTIAIGQEKASKLIPLYGATIDQATAIPGVVKAAMGKSTQGEGIQAVNHLVSGPLNAGLKRMMGLDTTKVLGKNTGMLPTGTAASADIKQSTTSQVASMLGAKTVDQARIDQQAFNQQIEDKHKQAQVKRLTLLATESGDPKYIQQIASMGLTGQQIVDAIGSEAYNKLVDQQIRYFRSNKGHVDTKKFLNLKEKGAL